MATLRPAPSSAIDALAESKRFKLDESADGDALHAQTVDTAASSSSSLKKNKVKGKALPNGLLLDAAKGEYHFVAITKKTPVSCYIGRPSMLPVSALVRQHDMEMYADEEGMMKNLAMNLMINPFMSVRDICYHASFGGPWGDALLVTPENDRTNKRGAHKREVLLGMCDKADARDGEDGETTFRDAMLAAIERWETQARDRSEQNEEE